METYYWDVLVTFHRDIGCVFHLRRTCDVAETYRETSLRRHYNVLLLSGEVDNGKNIVKHRLSSGRVISPNERCWHRNNCLRELNEDKSLLSKSILVTRQRKGLGKKLCSVIQFYVQRHLTTVDNILSKSADVLDLVALQNSKIFFLPQKTESKVRNFQYYFEIELFSSPKNDQKLYSFTFISWHMITKAVWLLRIIKVID